MVDYKKIKDFVLEKQLVHPFAGCDHVERVYKLCMELSEGLPVDEDVLKVAALLHDIAVPVYGPEKHYEQAAEVFGNLLYDSGMPEEKHAAVLEVIRSHTRYNNVEPKSLEAKILKDADGIDYLGATGIMRGVIRDFRNGKYKGNVSKDGLNLLDKLIETVYDTFSTERGKQMAEERIEFIKQFMEALEEEINIYDKNPACL